MGTIAIAGMVLTVIIGLLLWSVISGYGHWIIKSFFIVICLWFGIALTITLPHLLGWPTSEPLPKKFEVFWLKIYTPDLQNDKPGRILIWVESIKHENRFSLFRLYYPSDRSRLHETSYSIKRHKQAKKALEMLKAGKRVMGENNGKMEGSFGGKGKGKGGKDNKGKKGKGKSAGGSDTEGNSFNFQQIPPPKYRPKDEIINRNR